jgi:hypothetical protein
VYVPRDVVEVHARLVAALPAHADALAMGLDHERSGRRSDYLGRLAAQVTDSLRHAEIFLITSDMLVLLDHAARQLPDFELAESDPLASDGFVLFANTIDVPISRGAVWPITGFAWYHAERGADTSSTDPRRGILLTLWSRPEDNDDFDPSLGVEIPLVCLFGSWWWFGEHWRSTADAQQWPAWVGAFFRLVASRVVREEGHHQSRAERRRGQRAGVVEPSPVRVITLREAAHRADDIDADEADEGRRAPRWSHRWVVSGHWRQQWYATEQRHAPVWIDPYVKGPKDVPLVPKKTVRVWRR